MYTRTETLQRCLVMYSVTVYFFINSTCNRVVVMHNNQIIDFDINKAVEMEKGIDEDLYRCAIKFLL